LSAAVFIKSWLQIYVYAGAFIDIDSTRFAANEINKVIISRVTGDSLSADVTFGWRANATR